MNAFRKVINPGMVEGYSSRHSNVFCEIEYDKDGCLSITGVVGPRKGGNCDGGCGQIQDTLLEISIHNLAPGWTKGKIKKLFDMWERWHLNDLRPNCEHQIGGEWEYRDVVFNTVKLSYKSRAYLKKIATQETDAYNIETGNGLSLAYKNAQLQQTRDALLALIEAENAGLYKYEGVWDGTISPDIIPTLNEFLKRDEVQLDIKQQKKGNSWLYPNQHPLGILTKECPVCGYRYGSAWKKEEVPQDVLEFLVGLPNTTIQPAWV